MDDGDGTMMVLSKDNEIRFFSRFLMCPSTGIAYSNPEPNSFSFNSPKGACLSCNGLGFKKTVDFKKIIPDNSISINNGGIAPLQNKNTSWIIDQLEIIGKKYDFNLNTPIKNISKDGLDAVLYGTKENIKVNLKAAGISKVYKINFDGIVSFIEEQLNNYSSRSLEKWASKYMTSHLCKSCSGARLNKESSHFKIDGKSIYEVSSLDIKSLKFWISNIEKSFSKNEKIIAKQIVKELLKRIQFILDIRTEGF